MDEVAIGPMLGSVMNTFHLLHSTKWDWNLYISGCLVIRRTFILVWGKAGVPGSKWGNPYHVHDHGRKRAIQKYEERLRNISVLMRSIIELRGKILGCSCKPLPCHGDVLVKVYKEMMCSHNPAPLPSLQPHSLAFDKSSLPTHSYWFLYYRGITGVASPSMGRMKGRVGLSHNTIHIFL